MKNAPQFISKGEGIVVSCIEIYNSISVHQIIRVFFFFLSVLSTIKTYGLQPQNNELKGSTIFHKVFQYNKTRQHLGDTLIFDFEATSLALKIPSNADFRGSYLIAGQDTFHFTENPDVEISDNYKVSDLIVFNAPVHKVVFYYAEDSDPLYLHLHNSGPEVLIDKMYKTSTTADCLKPNTVQPSEWRDGLPDPIGQVNKNQVSAIVVHHSAGSNTDANYTQVVRNIYLYHTQTNKYDDIGYNYLVAQDGTIYSGRDGRGVVDEDNALGAHFCHYNTGTMGICLLGSFTSITPTDAAIRSLSNLISWKVLKEGLEPKGIYSHSLNDSLDVIAGHRDGCNTECPGTKTYELLPAIRDSVQMQVSSCSIAAVTEQILQEKITIFPNPVSQGDMIKIDIPGDMKNVKITLWDAYGRQVSATSVNHISTKDLSKGLYFINIENDTKRLVQKVIVLE